MIPGTPWRDRRFVRYWAGQSVSQLGDRISELALPLIAVGVLHASANQVAWLTAVISTLSAGGLTILFAGRVLGLSPGAIGSAFGVGATGALLGAAMAPKVSRWIGVGRGIAVGAVLFPAPVAIAAVASGPLWLRAGALGAAEFLSGVGVMLFDVNHNFLQTAVVPDRMRSRVAGAYNTVNYGVRPVGAVLGGLTATLLGLRATLLISAVGGTLSLLWLLPSPIPRVRSVADEATFPHVTSAVVSGTPPEGPGGQ